MVIYYLLRSGFLSHVMDRLKARPDSWQALEVGTASEPWTLASFFTTFFYGFQDGIRQVFYVVCVCVCAFWGLFPPVCPRGITRVYCVYCVYCIYCVLQLCNDFV